MGLSTLRIVFIEQLRGPDVQCLGKLKQSDEREVLTAAFDHADILLVSANSLPHRLLAKPKSGTVPSGVERGDHADVHPQVRNGSPRGAPRAITRDDQRPAWQQMPFAFSIGRINVAGRTKKGRPSGPFQRHACCFAGLC